MTARTSDPATSHLAATYIAGKRPGLKDAFLQALRVLGPSTANEIAQWCVLNGIAANAESVRKRALELVRDGLCEWSEARACNATGLQARTVRVKDAAETGNGSKESSADGRASAGDSGQQRTSKSVYREIPNQRNDGLQHSQPKAVSTPEAERVQAVAEFVRHEREWIDNWRVGQEMSMAARTLGTWPAGTAEEYIRACDLASAQGLIEREANRVRAKRVVKETKAVQGSLFE